FDRPQVGGLAQEGGAMDLPQAGEGRGVVAAEVPKQLGVLVQAEELADQFDGEDFAVVQARGEAVRAEVVEVEGGQLVIDQAKDGQHIIIEGYGVSPVKTGFATVFVPQSTMTCWEVARGVN